MQRRHNRRRNTSRALTEVMERRILLAYAQMTQLTGAANPFNVIDVGTYSAPALGDLDGDGDLDALFVTNTSTLAIFRNTGTATAPNYLNPTVASGSLRPAPALGDVDGDGDLDVVFGDSNAALRYYKNTSNATATNPTFVLQTGAANPFSVVNVSSRPAPGLGDVDGDGDLDLVVGALGGNLHYFKNTGAATNPVYTQQLSIANPFAGFAVDFYSTPTLGDIDGDGDLDAVVGGQSGLLYLHNTGTATSPAYVQESGGGNPFNALDTADFSAPALGDLDGDSDLDAVLGKSDGTLRYFRNNAVPPALGYISATNPFPSVVVGVATNPTLGDVDGDGDLDAVVGESDGVLNYFRNTGTATAPAFVQQTGAANPFDSIDIGSGSAPALADLDGDGDLDLVVGLGGGSGVPGSGTLAYFRNTGSATAPVYVQVTGGGNPFNGVDVGQIATPAFGDIDGDGDLDAVVGEQDSPLEMNYFRNTGSATNPVFVQQFLDANPFDVIIGFAVPSFGDVDNDGDLDLLVGEVNGQLRYLKNTGTATSPAYAEQGSAGNPFNGFGVPVRASPALGDLDGDGDLDLVEGQNSGPLLYYRQNRRPVVNNAIPDQTFTGPGIHSYSFPVNTFLDLDHDPLTYSATLTSNAALPAWLSFNPATRTFSGNPGPGDISPLQIRAIASDGNGVGSDEFQLTLINVADNSTHVTTLADEDNGNADPSHGAGTSLREAINFANTLATNPQITFAPSLFSGGAATITLGGTPLAITSTQEISGPGANLLTISGNNASRVLNIAGGTNVVISGITLANGSAIQGGGILNSGTLNLSNSAMRNNTATTDVGGAISSYGPLTVNNTVFTDNNGVLGGAINSAAALTVTNSTFFSNDSGFNGGALRLFATANVANSTFDGNTALNGGGAIMNHGALTLTNCTITGNTAATGGGIEGWDGTVNARYVTIARNTATGGGGGLRVVGAAVTATNTIIAGNSAPGAGANLLGTLQPASTNNLLNVTAAAAGLGTLGNHGGSTQTIPLLPNSPAINAGVAIPGITTDQRGIDRPQGPVVDIGAFERQATNATLTSMSYEFETRQAIIFSFNDDASVTFNRASYTLVNLTTGQTILFSTGDLSFNGAGTQAVLTLTNLLPDGNYRLTSGGLTLDFLVLAGDANRDARVNLVDFNILAANFGQPNRTFSQGDFNYDTVVNLLDFNILAGKFGSVLPSTASSSPFSGGENQSIIEELSL